MQNCEVFYREKNRKKIRCVQKIKAAFVAAFLCVAVAACPITASAWTLENDQQMFVDSMIAGREALLLGDYDSAINSLNRAIEYYPNRVEAYFYRAQAKQYRGNASEAVSDYSTVIRLADRDSGFYTQAKTMALRLSVTDAGMSLGSRLFQTSLSSAEVVEQGGEKRSLTEVERQQLQWEMDSYFQKEVYEKRFGDHSDHDGVRTVYNKGNAVLAGIEETYSTTEKETIYCGSGRTGICIIGSDSIQIKEKEPTIGGLLGEIVDRVNPFSALMTILKGKEEVVDHAPRYEKLVFSLSNPYTAIRTETGETSSKVKVYLPIGTRVRMLSLNSEGLDVGAVYEGFVVEPGEKTKAYTISGSIVFVGE